MGSNNITKHVDILVIYTFAVVFLISASVFAYKITTKETCNEVVFTHHSNKYRVGEIISFDDTTLGSKKWSWDFGDKSNKSSKQDPIHIYKKPGEYKVELIVNNLCVGYQIIEIKSRVVVVDSGKYPVFSVPSSIIVGEKLTLIDETEGAKSWEWRFGETASVNSTEQDPEYIYEEPGIKTISLIVNGNLKYITKKQINVIPKKEVIEKIKLAPDGGNNSIKYSPEEKKINDSPKETPFINEADFKAKLKLVAEKKITPKEFTEYFCGDVNKRIVSNGKNSTFLELCEKIRGKKIKIKNLNIFRVKNSNCIKTITIDYSKGWF